MVVWVFFDILGPDDSRDVGLRAALLGFQGQRSERRATAVDTRGMALPATNQTCFQVLT